MLISELIKRKRDGVRLTGDEIRSLIGAISRGEIPDYQTAALLMAIYFRGLDGGELTDWTDAMVRSGEVIDLSSLAAPRVDKHSTGGVGDKISLPLAAAVASLGVAVPMVSGRGLGHTGGTLDKLEAIPGFRVDLDVDAFRDQVARIGVCIVGQTARVAPADGKLYALRDVTGTVESMPLIASSILSKKIAAGIDSLVLDCKVGTGAFMRTMSEALELGRLIQSVGRGAGKRVTVVITDMNQPIGRTVGNALEVLESIEVLRGDGPADTRELTVTLGAEMLLLAGKARTPEQGGQAISAALDDGRALAKFKELVVAQGGDPRILDRGAPGLPRAPRRTPILAPRRGFVSCVDAAAVGTALVLLGGGRKAKDDHIDPSVGIEILTDVGDMVEEGHPLLLVHHRDDASFEAAAALLRAAYEVGEVPVAQAPRVRYLLRANGAA